MCRRSCATPSRLSAARLASRPLPWTSAPSARPATSPSTSRDCSGLMAMVPGMESKPMEMVENACASGGQAILSVIQKLQLGWGDTGVAVGYEKMRDNEGKMDGKLIGEVLGYFSFPDEREGKTFVFPHLFAEVMQAYMKEYGVTEEELA